MRRTFTALAAAGALALVAGCTATATSRSSRTALHDFDIRARALGAGPAAVDVEAVYRSFVHRVTRIVLVAPDGRRFKAPEIKTVVERDNGSGTRRHSVDVGVSGGSSSGVGVGIGLNLTSLFAGPGVTPAPIHRAKATIALPDPAAYRHDWARWRIAVTLVRANAPPLIKTAPAPMPRG